MDQLEITNEHTLPLRCGEGMQLKYALTELKISDTGKYAQNEA